MMDQISSRLAAIRGDHPGNACQFRAWTLQDSRIKPGDSMKLSRETKPMDNGTRSRCQAVMSYGDGRFDFGQGVVAHQFKVFEFEVEDRGDIQIDLHFWQRARRSR